MLPLKMAYFEKISNITELVILAHTRYLIFLKTGLSKLPACNYYWKIDFKVKGSHNGFKTDVKFVF